MKLICIASGLALILAITPNWSYDYYILLRWAIFETSLIVAYHFHSIKLNGWIFAFGTVAVLFNPIIPVHLSRATWTPIDLFGAILFFIAGYFTRGNNQK